MDLIMLWRKAVNIKDVFIKNEFNRYIINYSFKEKNLKYNERQEYEKIFDDYKKIIFLMSIKNGDAKDTIIWRMRSETQEDEFSFDDYSAQLFEEGLLSKTLEAAISHTPYYELGKIVKGRGLPWISKKAERIERIKQLENDLTESEIEFIFDNTIFPFEISPEGVDFMEKKRLFCGFYNFYGHRGTEEYYDMVWIDIETLICFMIKNDNITSETIFEDAFGQFLILLIKTNKFYDEGFIFSTEDGEDERFYQGTYFLPELYCTLAIICKRQHKYKEQALYLLEAIYYQINGKVEKLISCWNTILANINFLDNKDIGYKIDQIKKNDEVFEYYFEPLQDYEINDIKLWISMLLEVKEYISPELIELVYNKGLYPQTIWDSNKLSEIISNIDSKEDVEKLKLNREIKKGCSILFDKAKKEVKKSAIEENKKLADFLTISNLLPNEECYEKNGPRMQGPDELLIERDKELEKTFGIDGIRLYHYFDQDGNINIVGEVFATKQIKKGFYFICTTYDEDGDIINCIENESYGRNIATIMIMPECFFNGFPFSFHLYKSNVGVKKIKIIPTV